jgi:farnesyl diphosphate synthase
LSFEDDLLEVARETEELLARLLAAEGVAAPRLIAAMRYAALGGGKRLRPFLVVASAGLFGVPRGTALMVGTALECVHCYSLAHDDLPAMDNDDLRRGKPTTHRAFDEATAILAGDSLLTFAFEILGCLEVAPSTAVRLVRRLAEAAGGAGMAAGQMLDIEAEERVNSSSSDPLLIQSLKTGALFRYACEAGAILAGANPAPLVAYADSIGLAFQIADDLLDIESSEDVVGKATQKDRTRGKVTFVDLLGIGGARARAQSLTEAAIAALEGFGSAAEPLRDAARFIIRRRN